MKYAPIVLFTYNRPIHTYKTLYSLSLNPEFKDSPTYIFLDGPKKESEVQKVNEVRDVVLKFINMNCYKNIIFIESPKNKGLAKSIIEGVSQVISEHKSIIVLEDDCIVSPYFLMFMNKCLNYYKDNPKIGSISGYCPPIKIPRRYTSDVIFVNRSCSWGWGTWEDRWSEVDWSEKTYNQIVKDIHLIGQLNKCGSDRFYRLCRQTKFNIQSWSIRFGANQILNDYLTVYPRFSYVKQIGNDGSGVHLTKTNKLDIVLDNALPIINFISPIEQKQINKQFHQIYSGNLLQRIFRRMKVIPYIVGGKIR